MSNKYKLFDYRSKLWHPEAMEPEQCKHTINHLADDGFLNGSWTTNKTKHGARVVCESCGKFYGYLAKHATLPTKRPDSVAAASPFSSDTGSSSCSHVSKPVGQGSVATPTLPPAPESAAKRSGIDFAELRRRVTIAQVLQLIEFSPVSRSEAQVRGRCPVHRSENAKSRSFSANLDGNTYQCFSRSCGSKGNQLDLYAAVTGLPVYDAGLSLCKKLGIDVPWKEAPK